MRVCLCVYVCVFVRVGVDVEVRLFEMFLTFISNTIKISQG